MAGTNKRYVRSKAKEWILGESENGKPHVAVSFHVKDTDGQEKHVFWRGFFTEATTERTIESLRYMGFEGDDVSKLEGLDKNEVELVIEDEEYTPEGGETKITARVQWVNQVRGPSVKTKLEGDKLSSFAAQMKAQFRAHDASNGKRVGAKPAAAKTPAATGPLGDEPPPMGNEDIPF